MANQQQVVMLLRSVSEWNKWRSENPDVKVDLSKANLRGAYLSKANLRGANLSGAIGFPDPAAVLKENFEFTTAGIIVYKAVGEDTPFSIPEHWTIQAGAFLDEVVNPDRGTTCGCGVNVGTLEWVRKGYPKSNVWKCLIYNEDFFGVVVPLSFDGKIRCNRVQLLEEVKK